MQRVNFSCPCCIGNRSAQLHLLLRSWLLKVESKHQLCWLSACLYIRTQIVGELTACCCQRNKSCPPWPHLLVYAGELWTAMSFIWCVCHRHFLSKVPPPAAGLTLSTNCTCFLSLSKKGNPIPKPLVSLRNLFMPWLLLTSIVSFLSHNHQHCCPFSPSLHNGYYLRANTWVNTFDLSWPLRSRFKLNPNNTKANWSKKALIQFSSAFVSIGSGRFNK